MDMGERIKSLRLSKGMTQEELGAIIGVQKATIQKYEAGIVENIKRSKIEKLAKILGVKPSYLMGWECACEELTDDEKKKLEDFRRFLITQRNKTYV